MLTGVDCVIPFNLRDSFVAQPGMAFVSADYSQLEMRLLAHISQETSLLHFFNDGHDFFKLVGRYTPTKPSILNCILRHSPTHAPPSLAQPPVGQAQRAGE